MLWPWWGGMLGIGFALGGAAAWSQGKFRVFMKTLALVLAAALARAALPNVFPVKNGPLYFFLDLVLLTLAAFAGDYVVGLVLGRSDRSGYREDAVGH